MGPVEISISVLQMLWRLHGGAKRKKRMQTNEQRESHQRMNHRLFPIGFGLLCCMPFSIQTFLVGKSILHQTVGQMHQLILTNTRPGRPYERRQRLSPRENLSPNKRTRAAPSLSKTKRACSLEQQRRSRERKKGKSRQEKFHERHAKLQSLNVEQQIMTQQWKIIRESHIIMDAKPYASKFFEKNYGDLLRDDGDAKKSPVIDLAEPSSDEDSVELLGDNALCSDNGGDVGDDVDGDFSSSELELD
jgi:hypothetical protein